MSQKIYDGRGRRRNKVVSFRISPQEDEFLETAVSVSGLTKQDFIIKCITEREIIVVGNPRVYQALRNNLINVQLELNRINSGKIINEDMVDIIQLLATILHGLKENNSELRK